MKRLARLFGAGLLVALAAGPACAVQPDEVLADPALEARARAISAELRCMVCQNQSIDDSDADLARDLRVLVRERLQAGDSDATVIDFVVARYGEYVLLRPRLNAHTIALWAAPLLMLLAGAGAAFHLVRKRPAPRAAALSADERRALDALLRDGD